MLLPLLFVAVAALFVTMAQRMGREMAALPPLRGYTLNIAGSLAGVAAFARASRGSQLSPVVVVRARVRLGGAVAARGASHATDGAASGPAAPVARRRRRQPGAARVSLVSFR